MANVQWFFRGLVDSATGFYQLKTSTSSPADSDTFTITTNALSAGQSQSLKMVQQTGDNASNFVESGNTSLAFSVTKSGNGDTNSADTVVFELGYIVGTTETYFSEVINTGGGIQGAAGLYTFPATTYAVNEHVFPSGGRLIVKATLTHGGAGQGTWTYLIHINSSNYWTVPMHTVNSFSNSLSFSNDVEASFATTVNLSRTLAFANDVEATFGASGTGYNRIFFCDISGGEPEWMILGKDFFSTDINVFEDSQRKKILAVGSGSNLQKLLDIGQKPYIVGTGVLGRDYFGGPLTLNADHSVMIGNESDEVWKHFSNIILAIDNKQTNFAIYCYLDGNTSNPVIPTLISLGNGFYRAWVNKYGRRMEVKFIFDANDYPQAVRNMVVYFRPLASLPFINQNVV